MTGFYLMHRGWMDNPAFGGAREPFCRRAAWAWIIENAAYQETRVGIGRKTVAIQRGQFCHSLRYMATAWGWDDPKVRRFLARLVEEKMIVCAADAGQTIVTVCNYDEYQVGERATDAVTDADATRTRRRRDANKNEGNKELNSPFADAQGEPTPASQPTLIAPHDAEPISLTTAKAMAAIWREEMAGVLPVPDKLNQARVANLNRRFKDSFGRSLEQWRAYCRRIRGSPYLTGGNERGWKADFDFALTPRQVNKILEGSYDDRKPASARQPLRPARTVGRDDDAGCGGIFDAVADELDARRTAAFG